MKYVALLRGINVGGKNRVEMARLKQVFEALGADNVSTYINSGNVIFESADEPKQLVNSIEAAIETEFGFHVHVVLKSKEQINAINKALPKHWTLENKAKTDVMFLWEAIDNKKILEELTIKPGIDEVKYVAGAVLWHVEPGLVTKSGLMKIVGTNIYKQMTIRNANTLRKLQSLMTL